MKLAELRCECCWAELLRSQKDVDRLFTCVRAWRFAILQRKHRFHPPTPREWQQARFFEMELPLHAAIAALTYSEDGPFELLSNFYSRYPISSQLLDHQRRPPLFYALEQHWDLEILSWLVDKSLDTVMEKDTDGKAIVTQAIMNNCPEELTIRLAVAAASRCVNAVEELLSGQHYENARRFCQRALLSFFAGVPKFPHAQCRDVLNTRSVSGGDYAYTASIAVRDIWRCFVKTWGHFGPPFLQRDLPEELYPVIDSFVEVSIVAKGEPLTYQWFVKLEGEDDDTLIENANQSFIFLSQNIQPHNEGIYYCEVTNRRGRVLSTRMRVRVVDDSVPPDPTKNFLVDRALLVAGDHALHNLKAVSGGRVHHVQTGVTLVFPPGFFICLDRDGNNVSNSHGTEIGIVRRVRDERRLLLRSGERLVSCVADVQPITIGKLVRPGLLWLPHFVVSGAHTCIIVVEIDMKTGRIVRDIDSFLDNGFVRAPINRLGTFAVVSRQSTLPNGEISTEPQTERIRLIILYPSSVSVLPGSGSINIYLALVHDLPNCCQEVEATLLAKSEEAGEFTAKWEFTNFQLNIQEKFSLSLHIGGRGHVVFRWPLPTTDAAMAQLEIPLQDLDTFWGSKQISPAFLKIPIRAAVCKTPTQALIRRNSFQTQIPAHSAEVKFFEREWLIPIPVLRDTAAVFSVPPPTPSILRRTNNQLVLDLTAQTNPIQEDKDAYQAVVNHGGESNEFSPYFYIVELAVFSPTFWHRYDQTWWFDKTKTAVIDGMYKVVHRGFDARVIISTSAYAGCVRVARGSIDYLGVYSEPLLLTPLLESVVDTEMCSKSAGMLEVKLTPGMSSSIQLQETTCRLQQLLSGLCINDNALQTVYGLPRSAKNADSVVAVLEQLKTSIHVCNFELALLMSGFKSLERHISRIKLASSSYVKVMACFLRVQRAIPELDYRPVAMASVIKRLHELLREAFGVVEKLSSAGWMQYFLLDEWFEDTLYNIFLNTAELLTTDGSTLRCAATLKTGLELPIMRGNISCKMKAARLYLLLIAGQLQKTTDLVVKILVCRELGHVLQICPDDISQQQHSEDVDNRAIIGTELLAEFESGPTQKALSTLREQDCLDNHLVRATPRDKEKCEHVPEDIHLDLDTFICGVNPSSMHLVVRVSNVSSNSCAVQGKNSFCEHTGRLTFSPAAEFERKSIYRVTIREQELLSSLGGTLPERPPYIITFSTPP